MSNPVYTEHGTPIYVDHISWLTAEDHLYSLDWPTPDDYFYVLPHIYMEDHYYGRAGTVSRSLLWGERRLTAGDLALMVLEKLGTQASWDWMILAQTYPERHALTAPLARMLESASWQVKHPLGVTHMGALAGTETIQVAHWSKLPREKAVIVLVEQRILQDDGPDAYRHRSASQGELSDMAVALESGGDQGALQIHYAGKRMITSAEKDFAAEILGSIQHLMADYAAEQVILQSSLGWHIGGHLLSQIQAPYSCSVSKVDYQSGDVWIQLADRLQKGSIQPGARVLLISWDDARTISACCVHVLHKPLLSRITLNQEIKTS